MDSVIRSEVPREVCPFLYGGHLVALAKKDGHVRPIAAGSALRRLCVKVLGNWMQDQLKKRLGPSN